MILRMDLKSVSAEVELWMGTAAESIRTLIPLLPLRAKLRQSSWAGEACVVDIGNDAAFAALKKLEAPVCSVYPGCVALQLPLNGPGPELLISYGHSEARGLVGRRYVTVLGEMVQPSERMLSALREVSRHGEREIAIRVAQG